MSMTENDRNDPNLELFFEAARKRVPAMPSDLTDRIAADAARVQARSSYAMAGRLRRFLDALGGWSAIGGMATACAAGIWIGFSPPERLPDPVELVRLADADLFSDDDLLDALAEER
jgi:hypothetical protein